MEPLMYIITAISAFAGGAIGCILHKPSFEALLEIEQHICKLRLKVELLKADVDALTMVSAHTHRKVSEAQETTPPVVN